MAIVDSVKRLARLGMWIGVGAVTAFVAACGGKEESTPGPVTPDAGDAGGIDVGDAKADAPADATDATASDTPSDTPTDAPPSDAADAADGDTLWDVIYE